MQRPWSKKSIINSRNWKKSDWIKAESDRKEFTERDKFQTTQNPTGQVKHFGFSLRVGNIHWNSLSSSWSDQIYVWKGRSSFKGAGVYGGKTVSFQTIVKVKESVRLDQGCGNGGNESGWMDFRFYNYYFGFVISNSKIRFCVCVLKNENKKKDMEYIGDFPKGTREKLYRA